MPSTIYLELNVSYYTVQNQCKIQCKFVQSTGYDQHPDQNPKWVTSYFLLKAPFPRSPKKCSIQKKSGGYLVEEVWEKLHPAQPFLKWFTIHIRSSDNRTDIKTSQQLCSPQHSQMYLINQYPQKNGFSWSRKQQQGMLI